MPRIRWHGQEFSASLIEKKPDGSCIMQSQEHGARFTVGTQVLVMASEIISMDEPAVVAPAVSAAQLQAAMDAERETLPSVQELLAKAKTP